MRSHIATPIIGLAIVLLLSSMVLADEGNSKVGTSVFNFLKIPIGARPIAMGGAFTGVADDETSLFYNPAGIASLQGRRYLVGYHNYVFDMQSGFLGYIHPLGKKQRLSLFIDYLNYGEFIRTDDDGIEDGTFSGSDILFAVSYARSIREDLQVGGTVKLIYEKIDSYSATGAAVDIGIRHTRDQGRTAMGLMIQNLGTQISSFFEGGEKESLPLLIRAGASQRLKGLPFLVAADIIYPTDNDIYFALGAEYLDAQPLFIRLGWSSFGSNYKTGSSSDDFAGFSGGFGFNFKRMQLSYTLTPQAELGTSHRLTLTGNLDIIE
jgi:hypothetical protein